MNAPISKALRTLTGASLATVVAVVAVGCGGGDDAEDLPVNAVARVGDTIITKAQFDRLYDAKAKAQAKTFAQAGGALARIPDPPKHTKCIASLKEWQKEDPARDSDLRWECERVHKALVQEVMPILIEAEWLRQEVADRDAERDPKEIRRVYEARKKDHENKPGGFEKFLRDSGLTDEEYREQLRLEGAQGVLDLQVHEGTDDEISDEAVEQYYEAFPERFSTNEVREFRVVRTGSRREAMRAKRELEAGESFSAVAKRRTLIGTSRDRAGRIPGVEEKDEAKAAIFKARKGELAGPVYDGQRYWYVFRVDKIEPSRLKPLSKVEKEIRGTLLTERRGIAKGAEIVDFKKDRREQTVCREGYVVPQCGNSESPDATVPASGADPGM